MLICFCWGGSNEFWITCAIQKHPKVRMEDELYEHRISRSFRRIPTYNLRKNYSQASSVAGSRDSRDAAVLRYPLGFP